MGIQGYDEKVHTTQKGKVVYKRKVNLFQKNDIIRILKKSDFSDSELAEIVEIAIRGDENLEAVQDLLMYIFLKILGIIFPEWFTDFIEWLYENIDAGLPSWAYDANGNPYI